MADEKHPPPPPLLTLTSLRFFAAFAVVVFHYFMLGREADPLARAGRPLREAIKAYLPLFRHGDLMVDFFFVLSGFVLAYVYARSFDSGRFQYRSFIVKRFARIYPLHFFMLLVYVGFWILGSLVGMDPEVQERMSLYAFVTNVLMVHAWGLNEFGTFNGVSWSISAEWFAYLLFPIILKIALSVKPYKSLALALVWFGLLYYLGTNATTDLTHRTADFGILRIAAEFPLGVALCRIYRLLSPQVGISSWQIFRSSAAFYAVVIAAMLSMQLSAPSWLIVLLLAATVFQAAVAESRGGLKWLCHPALVYGGEISFSIYMTHVAVATVAEKLCVLGGVKLTPGRTDVLIVLCIPAAILASHMTYQYIEHPAREWIAKRFTGRAPVPSGEAENAEPPAEAKPAGIAMNRS